jgi:hypothetical protein
MRERFPSTKCNCEYVRMVAHGLGSGRAERDPGVRFGGYQMGAEGRNATCATLGSI